MLHPSLGGRGEKRSFCIFAPTWVQKRRYYAKILWGAPKERKERGGGSAFLGFMPKKEKRKVKKKQVLRKRK